MTGIDPAHGDDRHAANRGGAPSDPALDPQFVFGVAALHGAAKTVGRSFDCLDIGCGDGARLSLAAGRGKGLLVGVDTDSARCARARGSLAPHEERAQILRMEFSALDPRSLGDFDLLYCADALDGADQPTRARLLETIAGCLNLGGVAVIGASGAELTGLEATLAPRGIVFLDEMPPGECGALATSRERARAAQALGAGRRLALFARIADAGSAANPRAPRARWATRLVHPAIGALYRAPATYHDAALRVSVGISRVETQAALDELAAGPTGFAQLLGGARARLAKHGIRANPDIAAIVGEDLLRLAWAGHAAVLWKDA